MICLKKKPGERMNVPFHGWLLVKVEVKMHKTTHELRYYANSTAGYPYTNYCLVRQIVE